MKALVSGATGFIGSSIVRELLRDGREVKVLLRKESDTRNIDGLEVEKAYGDIRDRESMKAALKGCDTYYHTAALYANWAPDEKMFDDINVSGTKKALGAALEQGVEKVIYTSSIVAVGYEEDGRPANEETKFNACWMSNPYYRTKHLAEMEAKKFCGQGLPLVIVNPAAVIGVRDIRPTPSGDFVLGVLNKKLPGYMDGGINLVDVEDVARGHVLAARKGKTGERYILGNVNVSIKDFFEMVAEAGGVESPKRKFSYPMMIAMAYLSWFISKMNRKQPLITMSLARNIGVYAYYDSSKAVRELGMPQTPIRDTIEKAVNWFRENGYVKSA